MPLSLLDVTNTTGNRLEEVAGRRADEVLFVATPLSGEQREYLLRDHMNYTLNDAPQLLQRMRQALDHHDAHLLEISAHRLKSLVSSYNHHEAWGLAQRLEESGKHAAFEGTVADLERLANLIDEFASAVRHYLDQQPLPGRSNALDSS